MLSQTRLELENDTGQDSAGQRHTEKGDHPNVLRLVDGQRGKLSNPDGGFLINE